MYLSLVDDAKGNKVCQELGCGKFQKTLMPNTLNNTGSFYSVSLNCMDNEDFLWQCVDWVSAKEQTCQEEVQIICHGKTVSWQFLSYIWGPTVFKSEHTVHTVHTTAYTTDHF